MRLGIGLLFVLVFGYLIISNQLILWGNTEHLKAEELFLAKLWSAISAIFLVIGLCVVFASINR